MGVQVCLYKVRGVCLVGVCMTLPVRVGMNVGASDYRGVSTNACEFVVCFHVSADVYEVC